MVALPDDEVKEILYQAMPNLCYNYLDRSIKGIKYFFEIRIGHLEGPAPPPIVKSLPIINKNKTSTKWKASCYGDSIIHPLEDEKSSVRKKFHQYYGKYSIL